MDIYDLAGTTLGNYEIESLLGRGGMGVVYKTRQVSLNRTVALKILSSDLSTDLSFVQRFQREARAVAQLNHPHIVQIYDIEEVDGIHFFSMEYVHGQTLNEILKEEGQLSVDESIKIISQAGAAVKHAHSKSIVHRDLKPHNILLDSDDNVKVMDFGLARITSETTGLTESGAFLGTVGYMSPEQCLGEELDSQADIYSLGVVLYEMLTGRLPFDEKNPVALMNKVTHEDPVEAREINPELPAGLSSVVAKAMARNKKNRCATISEFLHDLTNYESVDIADFSLFDEPFETKALSTAKRRAIPHFRKRRAAILSIILACLLLTIGFFFRETTAYHIAGIVLALLDFKTSLTERLEHDTTPSIAVLPFADLSPQGDQQHFCDGLSLELTHKLGQSRGLRVVAPTSAFLLKSNSSNVSGIASQVGPQNVLEGSVRRSGSRLRITLELTKVPNGGPLWSQKYDRDIDEIPSILNETTLAILNMLKAEVSEDDKGRLSKPIPVDPVAYDLYLKGQSLMNQKTDQGLKLAIDSFSKAVEKEPGFAQAYAKLACSYAIFPQYSQSNPIEFFSKAKAAAKKALEIDKDLSEAYISMGLVKTYQEYDWGGAEEEYRQAIELGPYSALAHHQYAFYLLWTGRFDEAIQEIQQACELDPLSPVTSRDLGEVYYFARKYHRAIRQLRQAQKMDANLSATHLLLGLAYSDIGLTDRAIAEFQEEEKISTGLNEYAESAVGVGYAAVGNRAKAQKILDDLLNRPNEKYFTPYGMARLSFALGKTEQGFKMLSRAYEIKDYNLCRLKIDPLFDDPAFMRKEQFSVLFKDMGFAIHKEALWELARKGNRDKVKDLLDKGADVDSKGEYDNTALIGAAEEGHADIVRLLLADGAYVDARNQWQETALILAAEEGHTEVIRQLLENNAAVNLRDEWERTALMWAAIRGHAHIAAMLLAEGADISAKDRNGKRALEMALEEGSSELARLLEEADAATLALPKAAKECDVNIVRGLLRKGACVNATDKDGVTPLLHAGRRGCTDIASLLLSRGADVNAKDKHGETTLMWAANFGHTETVKVLLSMGADVSAEDTRGWTALTLASEAGHTDIVQVLLQKKKTPKSDAEPDSIAMIMAALNGNTEIVKTLLKKGVYIDVRAPQTLDKVSEGSTPLITSAFRGHIATVKLLIDNGADVNAKSSRGSTALIAAATKGHTEIVSVLLNRGANVNARTEFGTTALIAAAYRGHTDSVKLLLESGSNVNLKEYTDGYSAIELAAFGGHAEILNALLDKGADINIRNTYKETPLMRAAQNGHIDAVRILLTKGSDINAKDEKGKTALMIASKEGHRDVVQLLTEAGAKE
jgi:ankyrin repeat protein/serine/threonine protein kinase/Flp pilus assembly protein TadD